MSNHLLRLTLVSILTLGIAACAGDKAEETVPDESVEILYNKATDLMDQKEYKSAAKAFAEVERQHPYSEWATRAQLMEGYADYLNMDYDEAVVALDNFIQLHPGHKDVAYATYLRTLSFYERIADVRRDQTFSREALNGLQEIINRFPDTTYAKDAKLKVALVNDHMAGAEMGIGRWYVGQKQYIAAANRFRIVVEKYNTTSHVPEALLRLVECYLSLGLVEEAQKNAAVLGHNFPGSSWYQDAYNLMQKKNVAPAASPEPAKETVEQEQPGWFSRQWNSLWDSVF